MSQETMTPSTASPRRWPKVLLAVSLLFNLLVVGAIIGANLREERDARMFPPPDHDNMRAMGVAPFFDAMPREARRQMGQRLRDQPGGGPFDRQALNREFSDILAALRAEPFDPQAVAAVLDAQQARVTARIEAGRDALVESLAQMSPAERAQFADRLEERVSRPPMPMQMNH